jgi:hyperosmotically inducible periplasmic protein
MAPQMSAMARIALAALLLGHAAACERQPAGGRAGSLPGAVSDRSVTQPDEQPANVAADAAMTARVKAALMADPALKSLDITVNIVNGAVTLSGTIDTPHHLERATQVAKAVAGVKSVSNQLNVKAPT